MPLDTPSGEEPAPDGAVRLLLQSVVDVARAIFGAAAGSVFLLDDSDGALVFQAVSGAGEDFLVGTRLPADRGIAGWVAASGEAMVVDDLATTPVFDREFAAATSYVPRTLMAAPLVSRGRVLGVLEVLDPSPRARADLADLDLLTLFAHQAAIALRVAADHAEQAARVARETPVADEETLVEEFRRFLRQRAK
ncbi:GAF domain-containing protein [Actinacidiphila yanglinensis]|uniref:GAF domain-containing protein n=1 Tax=Actinacidiphila yanglinensis TaxID=310779 RepID=A0A1H6B017_9ACTN|nr:GAF domain-containing protein [Actinacidiphila yanglinensis]SEG54213.1 GAF domain-containing protein [Actinacidiphila yanglinensis]